MAVALVTIECLRLHVAMYVCGCEIVNLVYILCVLCVYLLVYATIVEHTDMLQ